MADSGIFLAAGFILGTLPFAAAGAFKHADVTVFQVYGLMNESLAGLLILIGIVLWARYQDFTEKWAGWYPYLALTRPQSNLQQIIGMVETAPTPARERLGPGRILSYVLFALAIGYVLTSDMFLFLASP